MPEDANTAPDGKPDSTPGQNDLNTGSDQNTNDSGNAPDNAPKPDFKDRILAQKSFEIREKTRQVNELTGRLQALESVVKTIQPPVAGESTTTPPAVKPLTQQEIEAQAEKIADAKLAKRDFDRACNEVAEKGMKAFPDFGQAYTRAFIVGDEPPPVDFLQTVVKLKNPHQILYTLAQDPEEAHRIISLPRDERTVELVRLESKAAEVKPKVSGATPPIKPVEGKRPSGAVDLLDPTTSTEEWMAKRAAEKRARFEQTTARRRA